MSVDLFGLISGSGWAAGLNLYAVAFLLGIVGRLGLAPVPEVLTHSDVLAMAGGLYLLEFVTDKVPYVDNLWDAAHTVVRPLGAAAIGYLLAGEATTAGQALAAAVSGSLAATSHAAKASTRAAVNVSPEPFSNIFLSLTEDVLVAVIVALAIVFPVVVIAVVALFAFLAVFFTVKLWGAVRKLLRRRRAGRARTATT